MIRFILSLTDSGHFVSYIGTINHIPPDDYQQRMMESCSTLLAQGWRDESWKKIIHGVTVPHPWEFLDPFVNHRPSKCETEDPLGYIQVMTSLRPDDHKKARTSLGFFKPFFGGSTTEKVSYDGKKFVAEAPSMLRRSLENLRYINWGTLPSSNFATLLRSVAESMTDVDTSVLVPVEGQITGSDAHRWGDNRTSHHATIALSYLSSTHFSVNTSCFSPENQDRLRE